MMKKIFFLCVFITVSFASFADTIDMEQARVLALAHSNSLKKYDMAIRGSILDERNHLYSMLPTVQAGYSGSVHYLKDWEFVNPADTLNSGATLSLTQIIFAGGRNLIQRAIGKISTESARKDAMNEYFNVLDAVDNAYYAVLEAEATLEAEESSLETAAVSLSIAEIRRAGGMINQIDYLKAMAEKESRENARNQARRNVALCKAKFNSLTGISGAIELEPVDFNTYEDALKRLEKITDEDANALFEQLWELLLASNPSLAKAALNSQRAEKSLSLTKREYYAPTISATIFSTGVNFSTRDGFSSTSSGGVSITGKIPLDFWVMANRVERSRLARDSAALDYQNAENSLETELQSALLGAFAQAGAVLSSRRSLEYTEKHFEYVMERYRLSASSVSDIGEASLLLMTTRNSHIKACYGFLQSLSRLRSLIALFEEEKLLGILQGN
jgi:outer membrane protein TolC